MMIENIVKGILFMRQLELMATLQNLYFIRKINTKNKPLDNGIKNNFIYACNHSSKNNHTSNNFRTNNVINELHDIEEWEQIEIPANLPILYRKKLDPNLCVSFESFKGQQKFKEAINTNFMNIYYILAPQFCTQDHPNYCGVSNLVMILNGLRVDPGKMWKYPWRWYDEKMLNTCTPMKKIEAQGIDITALMCIAYQNKLDVIGVRASKMLSLDQFRSDIEESSSSYDKVMLLNYSRNSFNQTGTGHFATVGGYHKEDDRLLLLDTARFKYSPHWVKVDKMLKAMQEIAVAGNGKTDNMPRGYMILKKATGSSQLTVKFTEKFQLTFNDINISILTAISCWQNWLKEKEIDNDLVKITIYKMAELLLQTNIFSLCSITILEALDRLQLHRTNIHSKIENIISICHNLHYIAPKKDAVNILTFFILFWPYRTLQENKSKGSMLEELIEDDLNIFDISTTRTIQEQIHFLEELAEHREH